MSDPFADLPSLLDHVWLRLERGADDPRDPFRFVTLVTSGEEGPDARIVALRRADRASEEVEVHSDLRTAKVRALRFDPRATLLAWDPNAQIQVRLRMSVRILAGHAERWAMVPEEARLNYGTDPAPGTPLTQPEDLTRAPALERFAVLIGRVDAIDVVSLTHEPHRRSVFDGLGARWIAP